MEKKVVTKTIELEQEVYIAEDGTEFDSEFLCEQYEIGNRFKEIPEGLNMFSVLIPFNEDDKIDHVEIRPTDSASHADIVVYTGDDFDYANKWCNHSICWGHGVKFSDRQRTYINISILYTIWDNTIIDWSCADMCDVETVVNYLSAIDKAVTCFA